MTIIEIKINQVIKVGNYLFMNIWIEDTQDGMSIQDNELCELSKKDIDGHIYIYAKSKYLGEFMLTGEELKYYEKYKS